MRWRQTFAVLLAGVACADRMTKRANRTLSVLSRKSESESNTTAEARSESSSESAWMTLTDSQHKSITLVTTDDWAATVAGFQRKLNQAYEVLHQASMTNIQDIQQRKLENMQTLRVKFQASFAKLTKQLVELEVQEWKLILAVRHKVHGGCCCKHAGSSHECRWFPTNELTGTDNHCPDIPLGRKGISSLSDEAEENGVEHHLVEPYKDYIDYFNDQTGRTQALELEKQEPAHIEAMMEQCLRSESWKYHMGTEAADVLDKVKANLHEPLILPEIEALGQYGMSAQEPVAVVAVMKVQATRTPVTASGGVSTTGMPSFIRPSRLRITLGETTRGPSLQKEPEVIGTSKDNALGDALSQAFRRAGVSSLARPTTPGFFNLRERPTRRRPIWRPALQSSQMLPNFMATNKFNSSSTGNGTVFGDFLRQAFQQSQPQFMPLDNLSDERGFNLGDSFQLGQDIRQQLVQDTKREPLPQELGDRSDQFLSSDGLPDSISGPSSIKVVDDPSFLEEQQIAFGSDEEESSLHGDASKALAEARLWDMIRGQQAEAAVSEAEEMREMLDEAASPYAQNSPFNKATHLPYPDIGLN